MIEVSAEQVLAWRLHRQYLEPLTDADPVEIVGRLCGTQAQVASAAETAIALRQRNPRHSRNIGYPNNCSTRAVHVANPRAMRHLNGLGTDSKQQHQAKQ